MTNLSDLKRGDVLVNLKSRKQYAVLDARATEQSNGRQPGVEIMGIRNDKNYGPYRWIKPSELRGWGVIEGARVIFTSPNWHGFTKVERVDPFLIIADGLNNQEAK